MKPILLSPISTSDISEEQWLSWRQHGPAGDILFIIGASDIATAMGISPFKSDLELYNEKQGIFPPVTLPRNEEALEAGKDAEEYIAFAFLKLLKKKYGSSNVRLFLDKHMYQCADQTKDGHLRYPYACINIDAIAQIRQTNGIWETYVVEIKTTDSQAKKAIKDWKNHIVPEHYEYQVRYQLKVLDLQKAFIVCSWDYKNLTYTLIERDLQKEQVMMEKADSFYQCLVKKETPPLSSPAVLTRLYQERLSPNPEPISFSIPTSYADPVHDLALSSQRIQQLKKELQTENARRERAITKLFPLFENAQTGTFYPAAGERYIIEAKPQKKSIKPDEEEIRIKYPKLYQSCCTAFSMERFQELAPDEYQAMLKQTPGTRKWVIK